MATFGKLKERIKRTYGTQQAFAEVMGIDKATLNAKLNGNSDFTLPELKKIGSIFGIEINEIED